MIGCIIVSAGYVYMFMVCACHGFTLKQLKKPVMFFPCTEYGMFKLN